MQKAEKNRKEKTPEQSKKPDRTEKKPDLAEELRFLRTRELVEPMEMACQGRCRMPDA